MTEVLVPAGYVTIVYDPVFSLSSDGTRYVSTPSHTPIELPAPGLPFSLVFRGLSPATRTFCCKSLRLTRPLRSAAFRHRSFTIWHERRGFEGTSPAKMALPASLPLEFSQGVRQRRYVNVEGEPAPLSSRAGKSRRSNYIRSRSAVSMRFRRCRQAVASVRVAEMHVAAVHNGSGNDRIVRHLIGTGYLSWSAVGRRRLRSLWRLGFTTISPEPINCPSQHLATLLLPGVCSEAVPVFLKAS